MVKELNTSSLRSRPRINRVAAFQEYQSDDTTSKLSLQDDRDVMRTYMQEVCKTPLLTPTEEIELATRIQKGDREARNHMISANLRLVVKIAYDYSYFGLPLLDLVSEGNIGLIKAVERFDPAKGGKLSTYAAWWIKQSIKRALANQSKTIRLPVHLVDKIAKMRQVTTRLTEEFNREPTNEEIGYEMGISVSRVAHLKSVSTRPSSLDAPVGEDGDTNFGELISDDMQSTPVENFQQKSMYSDIQSIIELLDSREREIIHLRFGLDGNRPLTLEEVGERFKITRERVRQIQMIALHKMRRIMTDNERQRSQSDIHEETLRKKRMEVIQEFFNEHATVE